MIIGEAELNSIFEKMETKIEAECMRMIMPKKISIGGPMDSGAEFSGSSTMPPEKNYIRTQPGKMKSSWTKLSMVLQVFITIQDSCGFTAL